MVWSEQQSAVISSRGSDLVVAAAAGSGKTSVMVERVCQLLLDGEADVRRIAVVTFTRAAANEMKMRILNRLTAEVNGDGPCAEAAARQLRYLDFAAIGTLHSFCGSIIKSHYPLAEVDPGYRTAEDGESRLMAADAAHKTVEKLLQQDEKKFSALADYWGERNSTQSLEELLQSAYNTLRNQPEPFAWAQEVCREHQKDEAALRSGMWARELTEASIEKLQGALALADYVLAWPELPEKYVSCFSQDREMMDQTLQGLQSAATQPWQQPSFMRLPSLAKDAKSELAEAAKEMRKEWKALALSAWDIPLLTGMGEICQSTNLAGRQLAVLVEALRAYEQEYEQAKRMQNLLDYNDLEHYALKILKNEAAAREIRQRYEYLFVDEFQDISPVQDAILEQVRSPGKYFCVGDAKQSIYRFRSAAPELFQQKIQDSKAEEGAPHRRIFLSRNYRSSQQIVDFVNLIFQRTMSPALGDVAYREDEKLVCGRQMLEHSEPSVELCVIDNLGQSQTELSELEEIMGLQREAMVCAQRIAETMGCPIWDEKRQIMRPVCYRDIAVLTRKKAVALPIFAETLRQAGIPVLAEAEQGFAGELEIVLLLDVLKVIDNSMRDAELIEVMFSPLGEFTMEDLIRIRRNAPDGPFYLAVRKYVEKQEALARRLRCFLDDLARWKRLAQTLEIGELLYRVLQDTNFYDIAGVMPGGKRRQANIRQLQSITEQAQDQMLRDFVEGIDEQIADLRLSVPQEDGVDAVTLMTIHSSKGLEFPIVVLLHMGGKFNMGDSAGKMLHHRTLGFAPKAADPERRTQAATLAWAAVARKNRRETLSEEMRILYVALTRAKERLILIGDVPDLQKKAGLWRLPTMPALLALRSTYLDWVCMALNQCQQSLDGTCVYYADPGSVLLHSLGLHIYPADQIHLSKRAGIQGAAQRIARVAQLKELEADTSRVEEVFAWEYPYAGQSTLPAKITTTSLLETHRLREAALTAPPLKDMPDFMVKEHRFSAMDRGTFVHTMLQMLPADGSADTQCFAKELEKRGLLPEGAAEAMDHEWIRRFYRTELAQRIAGSPVVKREEPFNLLIPAREVYEDAESQEPILVQGIIDCCFLEEGKWVLVDYKTNRVDAQRTAEYYLRYYEPQLRIYARALQQITGIEVKQSCLYLISVGETAYLNQ
ncbi:MAG: helicase-exonuclease AddAB subunit AddA [Eubacteriales bacterium]|nr:helicase-exonuclease AddAB subunit AddA [Eubacteriales bacterium]